MSTAETSLAAMRSACPLVMCITNYVATNFAANVLLAAGASPAMMHAVQETGDFAAISSSLTINMGTVTPDYVAGMEAAAKTAAARRMPWVLDPVAHFATPYRREIVAQLVALKPAVIRGNASEIMALAGVQSAGKGVDAGDDVSAAEDAARALASRTDAVIAVTGAVDYVTDGSQATYIRGGHPLMPQVTAMGCALTALVGGFLGGGATPYDAAVGALAQFGAAGVMAGDSARGPGSFSVDFLDALATVVPEALDAYVEPV